MSRQRVTARRRVLRRTIDEVEVAFATAVLLGLGVVFSLTSPFFLTAENLSNVLAQAVVLAIVAFGMTAVVISGNFDLSVGSGVGLVGVVAGLTMIHTGSIALGVLAALGSGIGIGLVNGIVVTVFRVPSVTEEMARVGSVPEARSSPGVRRPSGTPLTRTANTGTDGRKIWRTSAGFRLQPATK